MEKDEIFREVIDLYLANPCITAFVNDDGKLLVRHHISPGSPIDTVVVESPGGFEVVIGFPVGAETGRNAFAVGINGINRRLRFGSFYVDTDGQLMYKVFLSGSKGIDGKDIARAISDGTGTFLSLRAEIAKVLESVDDAQEGSEYVIHDDEEHIRGHVDEI